MGLLVREAVAELKHQLQRWKTLKAGWSTVNIDSAIPVAEMLLAALEGPPKREDSLVVCPYCKEKFDLYDIACPDCKQNFRRWFEEQEKIYWSKPAERPPEKGDWIAFRPDSFAAREGCVAFDEPYRVTGSQTHPDSDILISKKILGGKPNDKYCLSWESVRRSYIVRRAADPLRVGDKVAFGSKEGEVTIVSEMAQTCRVKFDKADVGWFNTEDLTLVSPVYDRPAEKGDC